MPLYEYLCEACRAAFTTLQPMNAPRTGAPCPRCGSTQTWRRLSTFATRTAPGGTSSTSGPNCAPGGG